MTLLVFLFENESDKEGSLGVNQVAVSSLTHLPSVLLTHMTRHMNIKLARQHLKTLTVASKTKNFHQAPQTQEFCTASVLQEQARICKRT